MTLSVDLPRGGGPGWVFRGNPCLDIDFVANRSWDGSQEAASDGPLTVTRTTAALVDDTNGLWTSFGSGVLRRSDKGALIEPSRTNVVLQNRDLTNAAWTATNVTTAKTQTGIDGTANSASLLTASGANGTVLQSITLASSDRFQSAFVKRVTGSGVISMTMDNGSTWTPITVTDTNFWSRVTIPTQTLANPTVGFKIATSGDAIAVDFVQNEDGSLVQSSPISVAGSSATRNKDIVVMTSPPSMLGVAYTVYAEVQPAAPITFASVQRILTLDDGTSGNTIILDRNSTTAEGRFSATVGSSSVAALVGVALASGTVYRMAGTATYGNYAFNLDGTAATSETDATDVPAMSAIRIGVNTSGSGQWFGYIRRIAVWNGVAFTDDQLTWLTT